MEVSDDDDEYDEDYEDEGRLHDALLRKIRMDTFARILLSPIDKTAYRMVLSLRFGYTFCTLSHRIHM